jgi:RecA/RadA recombinase
MAKKTVEEMEKGREKKDAKYITTGSTIRDLIIGGNPECFGYKVGNIYNIVGDSSSGKTAICVQSIVANHFKLGDKFKWNYDDSEQGFTFDVESMYNMKTSIIQEDTLTSSTVEELYSNIRKFSATLKKDEVGMYIVDSLDGLTSKETVERGDERYKKAEAGKEFTDGTYGMNKQKFLSQEFFPDIASRIKDTNTVLIIISQVRDKINATMFEKKQVRSGGKALQFYCHTVEWLALVQKRELEDESGLRSGIPVLIETDKSKTPRPFRKGVVIIDYSIGLDDIASNIDYLYDLRTDKTYKLRPTKRDKLSWDNELYSRDELCDYIYDNNKEEELKNKVIVKWEETEARLKNRRKPRF